MNESVARLKVLESELPLGSEPSVWLCIKGYVFWRDVRYVVLMQVGAMEPSVVVLKVLGNKTLMVLTAKELDELYAALTTSSECVAAAPDPAPSQLSKG